MTARLLASGTRLFSLLDGHIVEPAQKLVHHGGAAETAALQARFPEGFGFDVHAFAFVRDGQVSLVDAGTGPFWGDHLGRVPAALAALGFAPEAVRDVWITHAHGDHILGVMRPDGSPVFPEAVIHVPEADAALLSTPAGAERFRDGSAVLTRLADRIRTFTPGPVAPGLEAIAIPGHMPGHTAFLVEGEALVWGDVAHRTDVQVAEPDVGMSFDWDGAGAVRSRRMILSRAAASGFLVAAAHAPAPGFIRIRAEGEGYRPEPA